MEYQSHTLDLVECLPYTLPHTLYSEEEDILLRSPELHAVQNKSANVQKKKKKVDVQTS